MQLPHKMQFQFPRIPPLIAAPSIIDSFSIIILIRWIILNWLKLIYLTLTFDIFIPKYWIFRPQWLKSYIFNYFTSLIKFNCRMRLLKISQNWRPEEFRLESRINFSCSYVGWSPHWSKYPHIKLLPPKLQRGIQASEEIMTKIIRIFAR